MDSGLQEVLAELERFGAQNDSSVSDKSERMLNITRDTGEFLFVLVNAAQARRALEIGTSNGYSTLWLANAVRNTGGRIVTIEVSEAKTKLAAANFQRSGLSEYIEQVLEKAGHVISRSGDGEFDFIFLDADRSRYVKWWPQLKRILRAGGLLVVDNAVSHSEEMLPFVEIVKKDSQFSTSLVPVGKGEFLALKHQGE